MSWIECEKCGQIFNTDDDPSCFFPQERGWDAAICEACREEMEEEDAGTDD